jgi:hypothetical protein
LADVVAGGAGVVDAVAVVVGQRQGL